MYVSDKSPLHFTRTHVPAKGRPQDCSCHGPNVIRNDRDKLSLSFLMIVGIFSQCPNQEESIIAGPTQWEQCGSEGFPFVLHGATQLASRPSGRRGGRSRRRNLTTAIKTVDIIRYLVRVDANIKDPKSRAPQDMQRMW